MRISKDTEAPASPGMEHRAKAADGSGAGSGPWPARCGKTGSGFGPRRTCCRKTGSRFGLRRTCCGKTGSGSGPRPARLLAAILLIACFAVIPAFPAGFGPEQGPLISPFPVFGPAPVSAKTESLKDLDKQIKEKKEALKEGRKEEKELMDEIVDLESTIQELDGEIDNAQEDLEVLTRELKEAKKQVRRQNRSLNKRLRNMYKNGSVGFLDVLMDSGSFSEFLTNLDMIQRILRSDEDVLKDLKRAHKKIAEKKEEVEDLRADLNSARATARSEKAEVAQQKKELSEANAQAADDIGDLEAEREALEARLAEQSRRGEVSNSRSSKYSGGQFLWPLPSSSKVTSDYGWRNCPFHGREFHAALDIGGASSGASIVASAKGRVVQAGWNGGFGNSVIIDHGGGLMTQYNHCSSVLVSVGEKVSRGETIAQVGSTGYSTGPHLDYRVYRDGNVDNPWNYL